MNYPILALIITNIIWGGAAPIFKYSLQNIPPFTLAFIRFYFASMIFLPLAIRYWQKITWRDFIIIVIAGFFGVTVNISFFFMGLLRGGPSINAPIIASSGPVFLFILSIIFLRERPNKRVFVGMLIALVGVIILVLSPIITSKAAGFNTELLANLFFVIATFGAIMDPLIAKKVLKKVNAFQFVWIVFLTSSLPFLILSMFEAPSWNFSQLNFQGLAGIIYGTVFSSAAAYFLFYWGLSKIKAQEIGVFTYIDPLAAILIAWPLLGEKPSLIYIFCSIFVFAGIFIAEKRIHWHPIHRLKFKGQKSKVKSVHSTSSGS